MKATVFYRYDITDKMSDRSTPLRIFAFSYLGEQREKRDVLRNADAFQRASGNTRELQALLYLKEKRIYDIVEFLIGNLLLRRPYDPYEYLGEVLDKYILSRNGLVETSFAFPFYNK